MSKKVVTFREDESSEMLELYVDGKFWQSGNYWDFDFVRDAKELLEKVGVNVEVEEYSYDEDEGEK